MGGKGKGYGKGAGGKDAIPQLEQQLSQFATQVYDAILDLNVGGGDLRGTIEETLSLRDHILNLYGVATAPGPKVSPPNTLLAKQGVQAPAASSEDQANIKGKLNQLVSKKMGKPLAKGDIVFTVTEGTDGGRKSYTAICSGAVFGDRTFEGEANVSKKGAEANAAKVALLEEFPQEGTAFLSGQAPPPAAQLQGQKRKAPDEVDSRMQLSAGLQLCKEGNMQKGDMVYETTGEPGNYMSKLSLPAFVDLVGDMVFESIPGCPTKSAAEADAASKAVAHLKPHFDEKHKLKQNQKEAIAAEKKAKRAAEKAEGAAAAGLGDA